MSPFWSLNGNISAPKRIILQNVKRLCDKAGRTTTLNNYEQSVNRHNLPICFQNNHAALKCWLSSSTVWELKATRRRAETWTSGHTQIRELAWSLPQSGPECQLCLLQRELSVHEGSGEKAQACRHVGRGLRQPSSGGGRDLSDQTSCWARCAPLRVCLLRSERVWGGLQRCHQGCSLPGWPLERVDPRAQLWARWCQQSPRLWRISGAAEAGRELQAEQRCPELLCPMLEPELLLGLRPLHLGCPLVSGFGSDSLPFLTISVTKKTEMSVSTCKTKARTM